MGSKVQRIEIGNSWQEGHQQRALGSSPPPCRQGLKRESSDKSSKRVVTQRPNVCSARSLRNDRARAKAPLGRYVATEHEPKLGRYVATELEPKLGRYVATEHSSARSLRSNRARAKVRSLCSNRALPKRRYDIIPCILVYPLMLSPEDRSKPNSPSPPF
ncbi:hypothetical protein F2Q69_00022500 [Brassica cretica]|uniref:Uncharacterized protein n=1 Tax=Brassica cretica TaxID=69181 RepID=A0A8S9PUE6_BRACR|nr:hypothetical protein F2Q69_00022500 [Brassica cretica]